MPAPTTTIPRLSAILACLALACPHPDAPAAEEIDFNRQIRPILSDNCFYCHGPDGETRDADLRLDTHDGATADLGGYSAIVPGDPDASELLFRVTTTDEADTMPPPRAKKPPLTKDQVDLLTRWIEQGAPYAGHWAFQPIAKPIPPTPANPAAARNPIDHFILHRLDQEGINPSPVADPTTLIRRAHIDITGILPSPQELETFLANPSPQAYDTLVERLLASPHFGERWGRHWLDQARYADSHGYSIDAERAMWPFRDWVIQAFNDDMPFDQFTVEQLAGDLLPDPTKAQLAATAFHRNTLINEEGGSDPEQFRVEATMDRVNTTGAVWLGLTMSCAQCHTHKFDPITHQEYYQLYAFFNNAEDRNNAGPTIQVSEGELIRLDGGSPDADLVALQLAWERTASAALAGAAGQPHHFQPATITSAKTSSGHDLTTTPDNSLLAPQKAAANDSFEITLQPAHEPLGAIRIHTLTHPSLPQQGPGRASNGNFVLTQIELFADGEPIPIARAFADHEQPGYPAAAALDTDPKSGWAINVAKGSTAVMNADHHITLALASPFELANRTLTLRLHHQLNEHYLIGHLSIETTPTTPYGTPEQEAQLAAALHVEPATRSPQQADLVRASFFSAHPDLAPDKGGLATANLMVMKEGKPRQTFLFTRGDFTRPDTDLGQLSPGVLSAIHPELQSRAEIPDRLDLARWLVDPQNPLTARVTVNRIWMRYFGIGLVETEEDFGTQGSQPSHPELLDWLASEFIQSGWSQKHIHRLITTSATYRQSSHARPDLAQSDPRNLLLARQARLRLDAEIVRDAALSASGLLAPKVGGPPVRPPQPAGVYAFTQRSKNWNESPASDRYRRALYTQFYRSAPYPLFSTFDAPDFQLTCTSRIRSNTPLQALQVANDPAFLEFAQALATRLIEAFPGDFETTLEARVKLATLRTLSRPPSSREADLLAAYARSQFTAFAADPQSAAALLTQALNADPQPHAAAALVAMSRALLNTDNFITRE
jgi:hypothetical protein